MTSFDSINPATGEHLSSHSLMSNKEVNKRIARAREAQPRWRELGFDERAKRIRSAGSILRDRQEELAQLMTAEMGKPIAQSRSEVEKCAWVCDYYADHGEAFLNPEQIETDAAKSGVRFDPLGIVFAIMPWNFPLWQVFRFAAPTLMAGNTGLLKHASNVLGTSTAICDIFDDAGVDRGVFNHFIVDHDQIENIVENVDAVTLTGSVQAGRAVGALAGRHLKPCVLELGGSDPFIVLDDADVADAVEAAVLSRTLNNGQSCIAAKRFIVEAGIYGDFIEAFESRMASLKIGDPTDPDIEIGPLARPDLAETLDDQVERAIDAGAEPRFGNRRLTDKATTCFYAPTILEECGPGNPAFDEETFGPVAAVTKARDLDHAIELANTSSFGLGASVWTSRDVDFAHRIQAGNIFVNGYVKSDPRLPFGGIKDSGFGRELATWGIREFVNVKTLWTR